MTNINEHNEMYINEMERNDLWLNVKDNYIFFIGKILFRLKLIEIQSVAMGLTLNFLTHLKEWATPEKVGE